MTKVEDIKVNIAALRSQLVALMKEGETEIPLKSLLVIIQACVESDGL